MVNPYDSKSWKKTSAVVIVVWLLERRINK